MVTLAGGLLPQRERDRRTTLAAMIPGSEALPQRRALHHLIEEADREAAAAPAGSTDHAFFVGVRTAAEDRLAPHHPTSRPEGWLERESRAFQDGYAKAAALIGSTSHPVAPHYRLPRPG